jgi:hypothetical protein
VNVYFQLVTTGHSRSKNGVASLAYDPVVHRDSSMPHGLPDLLHQDGVARLLSGNDEIRKAIRFLSPNWERRIF